MVEDDCGEMTTGGRKQDNPRLRGPTIILLFVRWIVVVDTVKELRRLVSFWLSYSWLFPYGGYELSVLVL